MYLADIWTAEHTTQLLNGIGGVAVAVIFIGAVWLFQQSDI